MFLFVFWTLEECGIIIKRLPSDLGCFLEVPVQGVTSLQVAYQMFGYMPM